MSEWAFQMQFATRSGSPQDDAAYLSSTLLVYMYICILHLRIIGNAIDLSVKAIPVVL